MSRSPNTQQEKEELQRRIRGLTTILHRFTAQKGSSKQPRDTHSFVHHLTTLLSYNEEYDPDAKGVIAVTASIDPAQPVVRILIATMYPWAPSHAPPVCMRSMQKRYKWLGEVVTGYYSHGFEYIPIC